jgi:hypothetical protein
MIDPISEWSLGEAVALRIAMPDGIEAYRAATGGTQIITPTYACVELDTCVMIFLPPERAVRRDIPGVEVLEGDELPAPDAWLAGSAALPLARLPAAFVDAPDLDPKTLAERLTEAENQDADPAVAEAPAQADDWSASRADRSEADHKEADPAIDDAPEQDDMPAAVSEIDAVSVEPERLDGQGKPLASLARGVGGASDVDAITEQTHHSEPARLETPTRLKVEIGAPIQWAILDGQLEIVRAPPDPRAVPAERQHQAIDILLHLRDGDEPVSLAAWRAACRSAWDMSTGASLTAFKRTVEVLVERGAVAINGEQVHVVIHSGACRDRLTVLSRPVSTTTISYRCPFMRLLRRFKGMSCVF